MKWILLAALLGVAALFAVHSVQNRPLDQRIIELTTKHAEQQASQNDRLAELQKQWQAERTELSHQRDQLESDRKDLEIWRQREPLIAQSILQIGTLALALLPLAVCALLLRTSQEPEANQIAETLVTDLMSSRPLVSSPGLAGPNTVLTRPGLSLPNPSTTESPES